MLKEYINYLNGNFNCAIDRMGFPIVEYTYPETIMYSSGAMIEYINTSYKLEEYSMSLDISFELNVETELNEVLGKPTTIMSNSYVPYDIVPYNCGIFEDFKAMKQVVIISEYLVGSDLSFLLKQLITRLSDYSKAACSLGNGCFESYDINYIHEQYFILYQQKVFIRKELEKDGDNK